ncbi:hypothetical protein [Candidatus Odyssella acanthamoebae]|uniref:Uncharacterized protein n=1 Tax=Candidatus Odyssella acanthamoebae TaxID=91604 RepID=A0A077AWA7_9PROT|nr:hypothetical protein [Candidatus Paracaedibacter acanthamoebae]AIK95918.1 hypothetical protein ID47_02970 [Candidatus Paracaedibacter acanthamoebae]
MQQPNNMFEDLRKDIYDSMKEVSPDISQKEWDPFGNTETQAKDNQDNIQRQNDFTNKMFFEAFSTSAGQWVLKYWKHKYLDQPTYSSQCDGEQSRNYAIWRDGQNYCPREAITRSIMATKG